MNKDIYVIGLLILITGTLILHNASSEISIPTSKSQKYEYNIKTPLFRTRLFQAEHKQFTLIQTHILDQNHIDITIPFSNQNTIPQLNQNSYTSYHTGSCIKPTYCPCITSGVFCGGDPTSGIYCMHPLTKNEY